MEPDSAQVVLGTSKDSRPLKAKVVERLFRCWMDFQAEKRAGVEKHVDSIGPSVANEHSRASCALVAASARSFFGSDRHRVVTPNYSLVDYRVATAAL
jgi:hypothetical protein